MSCYWIIVQLFALDLWIVGSTAALDLMKIQRILKAGLSAGIGVEVFDLDETPESKLPKLLFLALDSASAWIAENLDAKTGRVFEGLLKELASHFGYDGSLRDRLLYPTSLFDGVAELMRKDLRRHFDTPELARRRYRQAIHQTEVFVPRAGPRESVIAWFDAGAEREPLCLIAGDEGVGKSWTGFDGAIHLVEAHTLLPVVLTASDVAMASALEEAMAVRLAEVLQQDSDGWLRRLRRWLTIGCLRSRIFLFIDGLNEEPEVQWTKVLDQAAIAELPVTLPDPDPSSPSLGPLATLATCRRRYWRDHFSHRKGVKQIRVEKFSVQELRVYLDRSGYDFDSFQKEVQELLRVPRITRAVIRHHDRLSDAGEITVDRLIYEDRRLWLEQKSDLRFTDGQYRGLLQDLASDFRDGATAHRSREIQAFIGLQPSDKILVELTTSGVFEPAGDDLYRLEPQRLYHALGLLLHRELLRRPGRQKSEYREEIDQWFEITPDLDANAPILAAAIYAVIRIEDRDKPLLFALMEAFAGLRNVPSSVLDRVAGYLPSVQHELQELAEHAALDPGGSRLTFKLIERTLIRCSRDAAADKFIRRVCLRWIAYVHWRTDPQFEPVESIERRKKRIERLLGAPPKNGMFPQHGSTFRCVERGNVSMLTNLAITLVSARAGEIEPEFFRDWALVQTAEGFYTDDSAQIPWLLRFLDPTSTTALLGTIENMLTVDNPIWHEAAYWLCHRIPDQRSQELQKRSGFRPKAAATEDRGDPCNAADWLANPQCFSRTDLSLRSRAQRLERLATRSDVELPQEAAETLIPELVEVLNTADTDERLDAPLTVCRWRSQDYAAAWLQGLRSVAVEITGQLDEGQDSKAQDVEAQSLESQGGEENESQKDEDSRQEKHRERQRVLHSWAHELSHRLMLLEEDDFATAERIWRHLVAQPRESREDMGRPFDDPSEIVLLRALLLACDPERCVDLILYRPAAEGSAAGCLRALPLGLDETQTLRCWQELLERSDEELLGKLLLLSSDSHHLVSHPLHESVLDRLIRLAEGDPKAATEVASFAQLSADPVLIRRLLDSGLGLRLEAVHASYRLSYPSLRHLTVAELLRSAPVNFVSPFLEGRSDEELSHYADALLAFVDRDGAGWHRPHLNRSVSDRVKFHDEANQRVFELRPSVLEDLLRVVEYEPEEDSPLQHSHHLYVTVCDYLLTQNLGRGLQLLDQLRRITRSDGSMLGNTTEKPSDLCWRLMARHADLPAVGERLREDLDALTDDASLLGFAQLFEPPNDRWLWRTIETDSQSQRRLLVARAMTLASYAHGAERAVAFLLRLEGQLDEGWLERVHEKALATARRGRDSKYWFEQFLERDDARESWAAFRLFRACVDERFHGWYRASLNAASIAMPDRSRKSAQLRGSLKAIQALIEESWKKHTKEKFCHTKIAKGLFPWTGRWTYPVSYDRQLISGIQPDSQPVSESKGT